VCRYIIHQHQYILYYVNEEIYNICIAYPIYDGFNITKIGFLIRSLDKQHVVSGQVAYVCRDSTPDPDQHPQERRLLQV
jgi:hypothetical protein